MNYLKLLCLLLFVSGCDLIPVVIDESITLPEPIVLDQNDPVPSKPVPAPAPEPAAVEVKPPDPSIQSAPAPVEVRTPLPAPAQPGHWSYPGSATDDSNRTKLRNHLAGEPHFVKTAGMSSNQVLDLHDSLHENTKAREMVVTKVSTVTQYFITSCSYCKADQRDVLPLWVAKGWTIKYVDETTNPKGRYPRYEIRGADGSFREHVGSLKGWK